MSPSQASPSACSFCHLEWDDSLPSNAHATAIPDVFPVSPGHTLVIPRSHVESIFHLPEDALREVWELVARVRALLHERHDPDGFTIGINDGRAAGQTVPHAHIHLIPRREGDVDDPRGGIRWVLPERAAWWDGEP